MLSLFLSTQLIFKYSTYYSLQTSQSLLSNDSVCSAATSEVTSGIPAAEKNGSLWPLPNFSGLLTAALASRKTAFDHQNYHPLMMKASGVGFNPNPILALIANRSSQLFGFLRPVNPPAPVSTPPPPGFLDLSTILMLQNNILTMLNNNTNRQVGIWQNHNSIYILD